MEAKFFNIYHQPSVKILEKGAIMQLKSLTLLLLIFLVGSEIILGQNLYKLRKYEFGASGGILAEGTINANYDGDEAGVDDQKLDKKSAFLFKIYFDIVINRFTSVGVFLNFSDIEFSNSSSTASWRDTGLAFKYRFLMSKRFAIRPRVGLGYRFFGSSDTAIQNGGLATNLSVEFLYALTENNMKLLGDVGIMAQPWGTSGDYGVTIPPIPFATLGVAF